MKGAAALFVGGAVEEGFTRVGHQRDLDGIEDGSLSAAVIAHQQAVGAEREGFVLKVIPLDEAHGLQSLHSGTSSGWSSGLGWLSGDRTAT